MQHPYRFALLVLIVALGIGLGAMAAAVAQDRALTGDALVEIGKAALAVVAPVIFGVFVTDQVRKRDLAQQQAERAAEEDRRRAERDRQFVLAFRRDAIDAYNRGKAVRSQLRAAGLVPDRDLPLGTAGLAILDAQLTILGESQLVFERLKRDIRDEGAPLGQDRRRHVETRLEAYEKDLRAVIRDWEDGRRGLDPAGGVMQLRDWPHYAVFVGTLEPSMRMLAEDAALPDSRVIRNAFAELEEALLAELGRLRA